MPGSDLIIGGTGMLAGVTTSLLASGREVTVLSRGRLPIDWLVGGENKARHLKIDYSSHRRLDDALLSETTDHGSFDRSICWVHSAHEQEVCSLVAARTAGLFLHIMGSSAKDPANPDRISRWQDRFKRQHPALDYRIVVLGFIRERRQAARWLTHREICEGVMASLVTSAPVQIVGTVEPWAERP